MKVEYKKNKYHHAENIDEYIDIIHSSCVKFIKYEKNILKINDEDLIIPTIHNYHLVTKYNYNIQQLKKIAKIYKLKLSGIKKELIQKIFIFLRLSSFIIKIQKLFRGFIQRRCNYFHGPAFTNRSLCTNNSDFFTMDELSSLPYSQFFSFKDVDGFIYGFDIISLYNLILKSDKTPTNPYNRNEITKDVIKNIKSLIRLSNILKINIDLVISDVNEEISTQKSLELRCLELFQNIDYLGNYSDPKWFLSLNRNELIKFMRELSDIWNFRAQLSNDIKRSICPPYGDPFRNFTISIVYHHNDIHYVKKYILEVMEKIVTSGIDRDNQSLGAYYVLGALTLVNSYAAESLPWLFQSFSYF